MSMAIEEVALSCDFYLNCVTNYADTTKRINFQVAMSLLCEYHSLHTTVARVKEVIVLGFRMLDSALHA